LTLISPQQHFQSGAESEEKCRPTRLLFGCNGLIGWNDLIGLMIWFPFSLPLE
jgi:hypothetical protein